MERYNLKSYKVILKRTNNSKSNSFMKQNWRQITSLPNSLIYFQLRIPNIGNFKVQKFYQLYVDGILDRKL